MHDMALPISFRWDPEFVARIDAARGDVSRSAWVRRVIEQRFVLEAHGYTLAPDGQNPFADTRMTATTRSDPERPPPRVVTGYVRQPGRNRPSEQAKRNVVPIPKGKS